MNVANKLSTGIIDTHCHLSDPYLFSQLEKILAESSALGVDGFLSVATSADDWDKTIATQIAPSVHIALGIHPFFAHQYQENHLSELHDLLKEHPNALVGEIGLDFWGEYAASRPQQYAIFIEQIQLAQSLRRPVVLHQRKSLDACLQCMREQQFTQGGFAHGFSGSLQTAKQLLNMGLVIGLGCVILRENAKKIHETIRHLPADGFVLESDAPFMLPEKSNHPKNTAQVAQMVARLRGVDVSTIIEQSTKNARQFLPLSVKTGFFTT